MLRGDVRRSVRAVDAGAQCPAVAIRPAVAICPARRGRGAAAFSRALRDPIGTLAVSSSRRSETRSASRGRSFRVFLAACVALVAWGACVRDENHLSPDFGPGYALGFVGTCCMLLLLGYSARKRLRAIGSLGPLRHWFGVHMLLGILGPVAILFHANFRLGSRNSTVALACMLLVAASGVVGRLIYPKIHHGLYGHRASLRELQQAAASQRTALAVAPELGSELAVLESLAAGGPGGLLSACLRFARVRRRARSLRRAVSSRGHAAPARRAVAAYLGAVTRVAEFSVYERLFGLCHAFHLPLCFRLFSARIVRVVDAHLY